MKSVLDLESDTGSNTRGLDFVVGLLVLGGSFVGSLAAIEYFILR